VLDLNQRPKDYESSALTTELTPRPKPIVGRYLLWLSALLTSREVMSTIWIIRS
jgi:hypothetical protein